LQKSMINLRKVLSFSMLISALAITFGAAQVANAEGGTNDLAPVDVVEVNGLIDEIVVRDIEQAIERAESSSSQAVILQVNSLGGVVSKTRMEALFNKIIDSKIPIAVWVGPTTARAYGSAAQLLAVADVSAMADGTRIGKTGKLLTTNAGEVSFGDASATLRTTTVNSKDAKRLGALKLTTDDEGVPVLRNMLLAMNGLSIKGRVLQTVVEVKSESGDELIREAATTRFFKLGLIERLLHTAASPPVTFLLVIIGLALLIFEFFTAGIGIAGVVGAVCVVLGSHGLATLPLRGASLAVIILAMLLLSIDVQVGIPRFFTGAGLILLALGSLTLFRSSDGGDIRLSWLTFISGMIAISLAFVVGMPSMVRTRFATPTIGREWMIGSTGRAVGTINPLGIVRIHDAQWRARTNRATPIQDGQELRVAAIDGVTLEVEPLEGAARDYREMRKPKGE
jgi:membrane-bound serine protease (ClpP class)